MKKIQLFGLIIFFSTSGNSQVAPTESRILDLIGYLEISLPKDSVENWIEWATIGEDESKNDDTRIKNWNSLLQSMFDHLGSIPNSTVSKTSLKSFASFMINPSFKGRVLNFRNYSEYTPTSSTDYIKVIGKQINRTILLLPPFGYTSRIYDSFIQQNIDDYQFVVVDYPGFGTVPPFEYPKHRDLINVPWHGNIEKAIISFLGENKIDSLSIMAMNHSSSLAINLGLAIPDKVGSLFLINGNIPWMASKEDSQVPLSYNRRVEINNRSFPTELVIQLSTSIINSFIDVSRNTDINSEINATLRTESVPHFVRYFQEHSAQDLWNKLKRLKIPVYNFLSIYDPQSVKASSLSVVRVWEEIKLEYPHLEVTNIHFKDTRDAIFVDEPILFNSLIREPISRDVRRIIPDRPSPKASVSRVLGTTEISIFYSSPSASNRTIFGDLVPFGKVWRAGANEASRISFSSGSYVGNEVIEKGEYSLYVIPGEKRSTVIFNKIPNQWGHYSYKSKFDALRIELVNDSVDFQERLSYSFEDITSNSANVILKWENYKLSIPVAEYFEIPSPPKSIKSANWVKLLSDEEGDGNTDALTDGKSLSYLLKGDSLWFKFDLYTALNKDAFALNVLIDTDNNQNTGINWFGTNTSFKFEKALTLWMRREGDGYYGINGIANSEGINKNNWNNLRSDNLKFFLDKNPGTYYVGVSIRDFDFTQREIKVIGAVGEYMTWNDDIGDSEFGTIKLRD